MAQDRDTTPRLVAFAPGWEDTSPPLNPLGTPEAYTHVILAFITSYRWTEGARSRSQWDQQGPPCSDTCQLYLSASWNSFPSTDKPLADFRDSGPGFVKLVKQRNPKTKVLLSIGGWQQSNLGQQNSDRTRGTCKVHSGCRWSCHRKDGQKANDWPYEYSDWTGKLLNQDQYECTANAQDAVAPDDPCMAMVGAPNEDALFEQLADKVAGIVQACGADGIDFDIERTRDLTCQDCLADIACGGKKQLRFMEQLGGKLRKKMPPSALITVSPLAPYVTSAWAASTGDPPAQPNEYVQCLVRMVQAGALDFVNVQFYNEPDLNPFRTPDLCLKWYAALADWLGGPRRVTFGMCAFVENGTCGECQADGGVACTDPTSRVKTIVEPLVKTFGTGFGGVMFWSTSGDQTGQFSGPIKAALDQAGPPAPVPPPKPAPPPVPAQPGESTPPVFVVGIVLCVVGGLALLGALLAWFLLYYLARRTPTRARR